MTRRSSVLSAIVATEHVEPRQRRDQRDDCGCRRRLSSREADRAVEPGRAGKDRGYRGTGISPSIRASSASASWRSAPERDERRGSPSRTDGRTGGEDRGVERNANRAGRHRRKVELHRRFARQAGNLRDQAACRLIELGCRAAGACFPARRTKVTLKSPPACRAAWRCELEVEPLVGRPQPSLRSTGAQGERRRRARVAPSASSLSWKRPDDHLKRQLGQDRLVARRRRAPAGWRRGLAQDLELADLQPIDIEPAQQQGAARPDQADTVEAQPGARRDRRARCRGFRHRRRARR